MSQSAVDFILEQLDYLYKERKNNLIDPETFSIKKSALISEARRMENHQRKAEEIVLLEYQRAIESSEENSVQFDYSSFINAWIDELKSNSKI